MSTLATTQFMTSQYGGSRAAQRRIAEALEDASPGEGSEPASLESTRFASGEPPRIANAEVLESDRMAVRLVEGEPVVGFNAFLDGIQLSRIIAHHDGIPIVHGAIGAVVRERIDRRLTTWRSEFEERLYAPLGFLAVRPSEAIAATGLLTADTTPRKDGNPDEAGRHPLSLVDVAVSAVQAHREALELSVAEAWLMEREQPLYIDGGISGASRVAASVNAVGIIKSHRTLYGDAKAVRLILGLKTAER